MDIYDITKFAKMHEDLLRQCEPLLQMQRAVEHATCANETRQALDRIAKQVEAVDDVRRFKTVTQEIERLAKQVGAVSGLDRFESATQELERLAKQVRPLYGPTEDLERVTKLQPAFELPTTYKRMMDGVEQFGPRFTLPDISQAKALFDELQATTSHVDRYRSLESEFRKAIETITTPWLDASNCLQSVRGLLEVQGLGKALTLSGPFELDIASQLRTELGDWRKSIDWPDAIFTDPLARTTFYGSRGLDQNLAAFPASAFTRSMEVAGIRTALPPLDVEAQ